MAQVNVIGSKLTKNQEQFLRFMQILVEEDKPGFMTLPEYKKIFKEILENGYYTFEQKERLNNIRDFMQEVISKNFLFQNIYKEFMKEDVTTASKTLTQVRLETYINNIGKK
jgi:hypothetical protein